MIGVGPFLFPFFFWGPCGHPSCDLCVRQPKKFFLLHEGVAYTKAAPVVYLCVLVPVAPVPCPVLCEPNKILANAKKETKQTTPNEGWGRRTGSPPAHEQDLVVRIAIRSQTQHFFFHPSSFHLPTQVPSAKVGCPQGPKKERKKEMGHPRSQHFVLASREIESVTRRVGRWGFSKVYPWNGRIQP